MGERLYSYKDKKLPSVTTITSQLDKSGALTSWAAGACVDYILEQFNEVRHWTKEWTLDDLYPIVESARKEFRKISHKALDTGSAVHLAIERYINTGEEPQAPSDQVLSAFLAFLEWYDQYQVQPIKTEHTVYDPEENYAGTCDLVCTLCPHPTEFPGIREVYLVDFKSSKGIYEEMRYQVAAYRNCVPDVTGCGILRLDKETGMPEWKDTTETYEQDLVVFSFLCGLWWARRNGRR